VLDDQDPATVTLDLPANTASKSVDDTGNGAADRREKPASGDRPADAGSMGGSRPPAHTPEAIAVSPRMCGYIDVIDGGRITGWAFRPDRPEQPLHVEIRLDGQVLATTRADRHRPDLHRLGIGTGRHGFEVRLDKPIPSEERHRITAHARPDDTAEWAALPNDTLAKTPRPATATTEAPVGWHEALEGVRRDLAAQLQSATSELRRLSDIQRAVKQPAPPSEAAIAAKVAVELVPYFDQVKELIAAQVTATEMLQTRADALLASMDAFNGAQLHGNRNDRKLYMIVIALGVLSLVSLAVGIFSVLA
jgi:hypothetical protein